MQSGIPPVTNDEEEKFTDDDDNFTDDTDNDDVATRDDRVAAPVDPGVCARKIA